MSMSQALAPCQYKTGKKLGEGTFAVVREAIHISTNQRYAVKVINKQLMRGKEFLIINEINVLKTISQGHPNIIPLYDYFETPNNLYLVMDLCTGGELFDHILRRGYFFEQDAAIIIKIVLQAVSYLHSHGIVHRDIKPENILFRDQDLASLVLCMSLIQSRLDALADFGLSKMTNAEQPMLMTRCGTPGYMAPEVYSSSHAENSGGYSFPCDLWSIGVLTYFLLSGFPPFDDPDSKVEMQRVLKGKYSFEYAEWDNVSLVAKDFIKKLLVVNPKDRMTAAESLEHPWIKSVKESTKVNEKKAVDLLPNVEKAFNAKKAFKKAIDVVLAVQKISNHKPVEEGKDGVLYVLPKPQGINEVSSQ